MKVFISQSKPRSLALAQTLESFIRKVVPGTEPWVSDSPNTGIDKGAPFMEVIRENLDQAVAGVVCLTPENLTEPWILYEAGALSTKVTDRVWTILLDVEHTEVADPLKALNHTKAEKADVFKMIKSIHKTMLSVNEKTCAEADLPDLFEAFWTKDLGPKITELRAQVPAPHVRPDPQSEMQGLLREILQRVSNDSWRQEKTLAMLHVIYASLLGSAAPPLGALQQMVSTLQTKSIVKGIEDAAPRMGWQPQYAGAPLPLRHRDIQPTTTRVEPLVDGSTVTESIPKSAATKDTSSDGSPPEGA